MKRFTTTLFLLLLAGVSVNAQAQTGELSAVHGIPGLDEPVVVYLNGVESFSFDFGETFGPVPVATDDYLIEVYYQGAPVPELTGTVTVDEGGSYTAVAHLNSESAFTLSLFVNEISPLRWWFARLQIHHLAVAPPVDASIRRGNSRWPKVELSGLSNGDQATATDISAGNYNVGLLADDAEVFNTGKIKLRYGNNFGVYAVGVFPDTFDLIYLPLN